MPGLGIRLEHCGLRLGARRVLAETTLSIGPGEKWLLCGPNGAGKTQLIKLVAGLRWPTPTGRERRRYSDHLGRPLDLTEARRYVAYVGAESQDRYARHHWNHRIEEVVATGLFGTDIPLDRPDVVQRRRIRLLLARFGLGEVARSRMLELSYGQRRLALVARALAARPRLLLLDEVMNGLDHGHRERLRRALTGIARTRVTVVATAHRIEDVPPGVDHAACIEGGRVRRIDPARAIRRLRQVAPVRRPGVAAAAGKRARRPYIELCRAWVYREETPALRGLDWALADGEHWAVTGANGSGKTTFLGTLYGLYPVALGGRLLRRGFPPGTPLARIRASIGIVSPELQAGYDHRATLEEIVVSGLRGSVGLDTPPTRAERAAARRALRPLGIEALADRRAREVSYGELRLALIARSWVHEPALLLLDEPFTGLDPARRAGLRSALAGLARGGTRLVIAVHHHDDLPALMNRRLQLARGTGRASVLDRRKHGPQAQPVAGAGRNSA